MQSILVGFAAIGAVTLLTVNALSVPTAAAAKPAHVIPVQASLADHYLDVLKRHLTRSDYSMTTTEGIPAPMRRFLGNRGIEISQAAPDSQDDGTIWPEAAETMIGMKRLDNLQYCIRDVLARKVPGDLIECGTWRGGATIFMRGALLAYDDRDRRVWVADSFQGLPAPNPKLYPADIDDQLFKADQLAVPVDSVRLNFARYGLLDERVKFLVGWFKDTLPHAPIERLAILRVDADMYEGTSQALDSLYSKVSPGGYVIVDDYGAVEACRRAVDKFRKEHGISASLEKIDWTGVYWQKAD